MGVDLPSVPFAVFDEFGVGADDRIMDYGRACAEAALARRPSVAPVGVEGADAEQRARELLAAEYERSGMSGAAFCVRSPSAWVTKETGAVLRAIKAALAQQPAACPRCDGMGEADSGGIHPWGAPAMIRCECQQPAAVDEVDKDVAR